MIERIGGLFRRKFVRDTLTLQIGKVGVLLLSLAGSVVVPRLLGPERYGSWLLITTLYGIWQVLNFTGQVPTAQTRLAEAVGARDDAALKRVMGFYVQVTLIYSVLGPLLLWAFSFAAPLIEVLYGGDRSIVLLAAVLSLTLPTEMLYNLFIITFSSRRQMHYVAGLQTVNQFVLVLASVGAVLVLPTPGALVGARLVYSGLTLVGTVIFYERTRVNKQMDYPGLGHVLREAFASWHTEYWRFGITNALDKNVAQLFSQIPVQMVGATSGKEAAGYIGLALTVIRQGTFFTSAILDNLQAVVPQSVGRGDYARLWRNLNRVMLVLAAGSGGFYLVVALAAPLAVPILYGPVWMPAVPLVQVLVVYGAVATITGIFAPLYRVFDQVRAAFLLKLLTLALVLPAGVGLMARYGALGGAWTLNALFIVVGLLTALLTLPELRKRAQTQMTVESDAD